MRIAILAPDGPRLSVDYLDRAWSYLNCTISQSSHASPSTRSRLGQTFQGRASVHRYGDVRAQAKTKFINEADRVPTDALSGLVACVPFLKRLDGFPNVKACLDHTRDRSTVAVIAGGGSGHEPLAAGFVGPGLLAAAVSGDVFASPPAESILAAIRTVTGEAGCLLVVANYTGDRLNFGLAAEQAKAEGIRAEVLIVGDDCALAHQGASKRRGISGCTLVYKVAGAAAAAGLSLEEVAGEARDAARATCSCGVASAVCTLPGAETSDRLKEGEVEVGLGVHGEPGAARDVMRPADDMVRMIIDKIMSEEHGFTTVKAQEDATLMVNNLGSTPSIELYLLANAAIRYVTDVKQVRVQRVYVGTFCTSLDMAGFSITLQGLTAARQARLDAPAQAPGWPSASAVYIPDKLPLPLPSANLSEGGAEESTAADADLTAPGQLLRRAVRAACEALVAAASSLDLLDQKAGDGDCGSTLRRGAEAVLEDATGNNIPWNHAASAASAIGRSARAMGGTSGALYNIFFTAAAASLTAAPSEEHTDGAPSAAAWAAALRSGAGALQHYGGASPGDRTMLDALLPALDALDTALRDGAPAKQAVEQAVAAAKEGGERTRDMKAGAGRAAYVPADSLAGVADPGALAVGIWLDAVLQAVF